MEFTIAIPAYNSEKWLPGCLDSVWKQTHSDFRVVILDSGSTDGTIAWLNQIKDPRLKVYESDRRLSIEENWGRIRDVAKTEFVTILGHDDLLYPDFLEIISKQVKEYPDAGIYHTHFDFINETGRKIRACQPMPSEIPFEDLLRRFLMGKIDLMATGYVVRSADYDLAGGIPTNYESLLFADFELWLRLARQGGMAVAPQSGFAFRVHQSVTTTSKDRVIQDGLDRFTGFLSDQAREDPAVAALVQAYGPDFLLRYARSYAHRLLRTPAAGRNGLTVAVWIERTRKMAERLDIDANYLPAKDRSLSLSRRIDQSILLSGLFRLAKKIHPGAFTH